MTEKGEVVRKVMGIGTSSCVSLPPKWLKEHNIGKGSQVLMRYNDGVVTMKEAFDYMKDMESTDGLGDQSSLRDMGWLDDNGDKKVDSNDGAIANTVALGPYGGDSILYDCEISSDINGAIFESKEISFEITVKNMGLANFNNGNRCF